MNKTRNDLGSRMKTQYEYRSQTYLPRRTYTIIRLDGKAFHTFTRGCEKPYDTTLSTAMCASTEKLCEQIQGAEFAYVQSDEVSVLLTDFATDQTDAWFDGNVQKITSVSASIMTAEFNSRYITAGKKPALFDSRVFTIPDITEVENYFIWRQQDCIRNSISGLAQKHFSHQQLQKKNTNEMQEMLFQEHGINWSEENEAFKNGVLVNRSVATIDYVPRSTWMAQCAPIFTKNRDLFERLIPVYV